jgi:PPOX class probable F420-dependent enzyme
MTQSPTIALPDSVREFLATGFRFALIATIDPDGGPRQALIWFMRDGDDLIINSAVGRRWPGNLVRDPRISVTVADADGDHWVGIQGVVEAITDQPTAQADIATMARHYHADEPDEAERLIRDRFQRQERISFRVRAQAIRDHRE